MARSSDNAGPTLLVICVVVLVLVLSTTTLRVTVRARRQALGGDDYTIAAASLLAIGRVTCQIIGVQHGNGRHREFLSKEDYQYVNFLTWLTQLFLFPILCLLKISVCLLVLRIKSTKRLKYGLWCLIVLLILTTLLPDVVLLAECSPVSAYWTSQQDKCWNPNVRIYSIYLQTGTFCASRVSSRQLLTIPPSRVRLRRRSLYPAPHRSSMEPHPLHPEQNGRLRPHELGRSVRPTQPRIPKKHN
jgi:hypothetical protein